MRNAVLTVIVAIVFVGVMAGVVAGIIQVQQSTPPPPPEGINAQPVAPPVIDKQPDPVKPAPPAPPPRAALERIPVGGQDIADLQSLMMWKYRFNLPRNEYTAYVWAEYWTRDGETPEVRELFTASGEWADGEVVLKVPTEDDRRMLVRIGPTSTTRAARAEPLGIPAGASMEVLTNTPISPDRDIHLATVTWNQFESGTGGLANVHRDNDQTIYVKLRFAKGPFVPFPPVTPQPEAEE